MSVGNPNLTGIPTRVAAPPPVKSAQNTGNQGNQSNQVNNSARQAAIASANAPTNGPAATFVSAAAGVVAAPTSPGGTTTPGQGARAATTTAQTVQTVAGNVAAAMANAFSPAFMAATGAIAMVSNRKKASDVSGDLKEGEGNVEVETESEAQPDALQEAEQEMGAGEITQAGSASGPST